MVSFLSLLLAIALTYVVGDLYSPYLPKWATWGLHLVIGIVLFKITSSYLKSLKDPD